MNDRLEIASDWLLRMQAEPLTEQELAEWLQWYDADPANRAAFEKLRLTFDAISGQPSEAKAAWARQLTTRGQQKAASSWVPAWISHHRGWVAAVATAVAFALGIGFWDFQTLEPIQTAAFKTERAKHRLVQLPDGSRVQLGAKSQLFTNFTPQARYLVLEGGEAFFEVAKDPRRPFLVQAGSVTVRAVGTEFNVRRVGDQTVVAVTEGVVEVVQEKPALVTARRSSESAPPIRLAAGEQVTLGALSSEVAVKHVAANVVVGWQQGRLEFVDEPLGLVVGTINRYSPREIVITDKEANDLRFTGTVTEGRVDEWLNALPDIFPVSVQRAGRETVLISQRPAQ
jgi:transmembrane sensor